VSQFPPTQVEIFPHDSEFNSRAALNRRLAEVKNDANESEKKPGRPLSDFTGQRFGSLVVKGATGARYRRSPVVVCVCDCGTVIRTNQFDLTRKSCPVRHCGCQGYGYARTSKPGRFDIGDKNDENRQTKRRTQSNGAFNCLFSAYRYGAAKRGYEWGLTKRQFAALSGLVCHYCGAEPSQEHRQNPYTFTYNGIDRLDNNKGYTIDNCVPCCGTCNTAKATMGYDEFLGWINKVHEYQRGNQE
jgi:hypothetical protein